MSTMDFPDDDTPDRRWRDRLAIFGAVVVLIAAIITAITTGGIPIIWHKVVDPPPPPPVATATIDSPADIIVPHVLQLFGRYENLPANTVVYAVSQDMTTNKLFPQEKACSIDNLGKFNCGTYYIGSDTGHGERMKILIVDATADAVNVFSNYELGKGGPLTGNPGMDALPLGATVIGSKDVVHG